MLAAEAGADYVMFGEPDAAGGRPAFEAVLERVSWWAEVFQSPCVGYATSLDEVAALADAHADFIAVDDLVWNDARGAAAAIADVAPPPRACGAGAMTRRLAATMAVAAACLAAPQAHAQAPMQIVPQAAQPQPTVTVPHEAKTPHAKRPAAKPATPEQPATVKTEPVTPATTSPAQTQVTTLASPASPNGPQGDIAFGAFQRGEYILAFKEASRRASEQGDPVAMTLIGELYANGYGVPKDEKKALAWFSLAADRGDRQAMFSLAMFRFAGRGAPQDRAEAAVLLEKAAKLGHVAAEYNLALLYLEGQDVPRNIARAVELLRAAADVGSPEAQYALATLYKDGNGVPKDPVMATKLLATAARAGVIDAEVEYAIALFNGSGVAKDEAAAAVLFRKAAHKGNPIAQNRLARILASGRGLPADPVGAARWHIIARAAGLSDTWMENFLQNMSPADRENAEKTAKFWMAYSGGQKL